ncbi:MAG: 3-hydroxyacyl-CoA dehydrogenase NAD-binding domain-containing protein [Chitinophagales bacterium]|nr:3-hydroxyacyl-CoA dehydrogenase NAD-binding domain-containing protein [Chitinophagales bacterium]
MQIKKIAVAGAGAMGSGIAQVAARAGFEVVLYDISTAQVAKALDTITAQLDKLVEKGQLTEAERERTLDRLSTTTDPGQLVADLVIEAIIEKLELKRELFQHLERINSPSAILASNTSSFAITRLAVGMQHPQRIAGLHFFNPAPVMKLVEVIKGTETTDETLQSLRMVAEQMGKTVVMCQDSPGFIVNRVARHYYVESLKILEERVASHEQIDALMEATGFRMGPFRLMDMIGMDVNYAVTESLFEAFHYDPKFRPSRIQQQKVTAGHLGRKTGKGFYQY